LAYIGEHGDSYNPVNALDIPEAHYPALEAACRCGLVFAQHWTLPDNIPATRMKTSVLGVTLTGPGKAALAWAQAGRGGDTTTATARLSARELAEKYDVPLRALRGRLNRWQSEHDAGYIAVSNPAKNEPRYLYDESAVMPDIDRLRLKRATDGQRKKL
jgi:hypothetical protein